MDNVKHPMPTSEPISGRGNGFVGGRESSSEPGADVKAPADDLEARNEKLPTVLPDQSPFRLLHRLLSKVMDTPIPPWLKKYVTFYRLHFLSFVLVDLIGTVIIYCTPNGPLGPISFIDALFNATSALTVTGLVTVQMDVFSTFDKVVLLILMVLGSQVFTSLIPVWIRRYYFHRYLREEDPGMFEASYAPSPTQLSRAGSQIPPITPPPPPALPVPPTTPATTGIQEDAVTALPATPATPDLVQQRSASQDGARVSPSILQRIRSLAVRPSLDGAGAAGAATLLTPNKSRSRSMREVSPSGWEQGPNDSEIDEAEAGTHALTWSGSRGQAEEEKLRKILEKMRAIDEMKQRERELAKASGGVDADRTMKGGRKLLRALTIEASLLRRNVDRVAGGGEEGLLEQEQVEGGDVLMSESAPQVPAGVGRAASGVAGGPLTRIQGSAVHTGGDPMMAMIAWRMSSLSLSGERRGGGGGAGGREGGEIEGGEGGEGLPSFRLTSELMAKLLPSEQKLMELR